jgi:hypothetical protein
MNQFPQVPDNPICVISINLKNSQRYSLLKIDQRCHDTGNKFIAAPVSLKSLKALTDHLGRGCRVYSFDPNWLTGGSDLFILFSSAFITRSAKTLDSEKERLDRKREA